MALFRRGGKAKVEEETTTVFVCAVCKKDFKSKGQMSNHETSKAHKKKLKVSYHAITLPCHGQMVYIISIIT